MRLLSRLSLCIYLLWIGGLAPATALRITYTVSPVPPGQNREARTDVRMALEELNGQSAVDVQMPAWSPGDYEVQNHARYVQNLRAFDGEDRELPVSRRNLHTWRVEKGEDNRVIIRYSLPNTPPGNFSENVQVKSRYAFYNGPALFLYVVGEKSAPAVLQVELPPGWLRAISPLEPMPDGPPGGRAARFSAPDYDTLADSPLLVGECVTREFTFAGRPHLIAFFGAHRGVPYDSFPPVLQKIVAEQNRLMGGPPYARYVFFLDIGGRGGGLEHLNSARIAWDRTTPVRYLASLAAHEFFHLWNVKRIRPIVLGPFDYIRPPRTRSLWFCEGVTDYYAELTARRAGLTSEEACLAGLAAAIRELRSNPAARRITAEEASLRVWEEKGSSGYGGLSYYLKGRLIGLCLDLKIRGLTDNRASLDDVMRDLLARYGLPKPGFLEDGIREAVIRAAGPEMGPFYDKLCRTTEEMPFAECLGYAGLRLVQSAGGRLRIERDPGASPSAVALRRDWLRTGFSSVHVWALLTSLAGIAIIRVGRYAHDRHSTKTFRKGTASQGLRASRDDGGDDRGHRSLYPRGRAASRGDAGLLHVRDGRAGQRTAANCELCRACHAGQRRNPVGVPTDGAAAAGAGLRCGDRGTALCRFGREGVSAILPGGCAGSGRERCRQNAGQISRLSDPRHARRLLPGG